jgi:hypothetical protein
LFIFVNYADALALIDPDQAMSDLGANIGNQELRIRAVCRACRFLSELCLEVDTAQDDAGGSAFELPSQEFASGTLFNPIA